MLELRARRRDHGSRSEPHLARTPVAVRRVRRMERDRAGDMLAVRRDSLR